MRVLALLALLLPIACSSRKPTRCEEVCRREDQCGRELQVEVDHSECVDACTALDRDPSYQAVLDRHVSCVFAAVDCRAVLDCE